MRLGPRPKKKASVNLNPYLGLLAAYHAHHGAAHTRVDRNGRVVLVVVAVHRLCAADPLAAHVVLPPSEQNTSST